MTDWYKKLSESSRKNQDPAGGVDPRTAIPTARDVERDMRSDSPAPTGRAAFGGTIEDPQKKLEYFASQRFPDDPKASERYGYVNGELVYIDDEGTPQREIVGFVGGASELAGEMGLPVAGATAGALTGGIPGAILGGMAGLGWRKVVGMMLGDEQTVSGNVWDMATEGLLNTIGGGAGKGFAKGVVNRRVAGDAGKLNLPRAEDIIEKGREFGITVTPAEATDLASLINQQTRYGMGMDDAGDIIRDFYKKRAQQEARAVDDFIGETPSATEAGANVRKAAQEEIKAAKEARRAEAQPLYKEVVTKDNVIPEREFMSLQEDDVIRGALDKVKDDPVFGVMDHPSESLSVIDAAQKELWDMAQVAERSGQSNRARILKAKRHELLEAADEHFPKYAEARAAFAGKSPEVQSLEEGIEGVLARVKDPQLHRMATRIFSPGEAGPEQITQLRLMFRNRGMDQEWNDLLNVYLRNAWETQRVTNAGGDIAKAGNWRKVVFGSERAEKNMRAAMGPERFAIFSDLMDVLEATSKVPKGQSMTQPAQQAAKQEGRQAAPVLSAMEGFGLRGIREWWIEAKTDAWRTEIAKVITNQQSMDTLRQLKELKSLNPRNEKVIDAISVAFFQAGAGPFRGANPSDRVPPVIHQGRLQR